MKEEGEDVTFLEYNKSVLVPIDKPNTYYPIDKASDFWDVIGHNTGYVSKTDKDIYEKDINFAEKFKKITKTNPYENNL